MTCPCGVDHLATQRGGIRMRAIIALQGPTMRVCTPDGEWHVPRVWVAYHDLRADELPLLAKRYGWQRVSRA